MCPDLSESSDYANTEIEPEMEMNPRCTINKCSWCQSDTSRDLNLNILRFAKDGFIHIDRQLGCHSDGDGIARSAIDFDQFAIVVDTQQGEVGMRFQFADENIVQFTPEQFNRVDDEIVRERPGCTESFHATINTRGFK